MFGHPVIVSRVALAGLAGFGFAPRIKALAQHLALVLVTFGCGDGLWRLLALPVEDTVDEV